jgi:pectate lyase
LGISTTSNKLVTLQGLSIRRADAGTGTGVANDAGIANAPNASAAVSDVNAFAVNPTVTVGSGQTFAAYTAAIMAERRGFAVTGNVTGGQAGSVYVVTSTANSGVGSLRDALSQSNRWIVFSRSVFPKTTETTITLTSTIDMRSVSNITVDGFGARVRIVGFGITTARFLGPPTGADLISNNLVFLNIKMTNITLGGGFDCLTVDGTDRAWFYHLDLSQGGDGNLDITNVFAGPNSNGFMTIQNCYIHDSKTGKNCLLGDQTEGFGDHNQASSSFPGGNGGDNRISIVESRFKDLQRNPIVFNYWVHIWNSMADNWTLEGHTVMGGMGHLRTEKCVLNPGTVPNSSNAPKGVFTWTFPYADASKKYKRWANSGNLHQTGTNGTSSEFDASGGFLNPAGSIFTIPYSYTSVTATTSLATQLTTSTLTTQGRAGCVDRDGYFDLVT